MLGDLEPAVERFTASSSCSPAAEMVALVVVDKSGDNDGTGRLVGGAMGDGLGAGTNVGVAGVGASSGNVVARLMDKLNVILSLSSKSRYFLSKRKAMLEMSANVAFDNCEEFQFPNLLRKIFFLKDGRKIGDLFQGGTTFGFGNTHEAVTR